MGEVPALVDLQLLKSRLKVSLNKDRKSRLVRKHSLSSSWAKEIQRSKVLCRLEDKKKRKEVETQITQSFRKRRRSPES